MQAMRATLRGAALTRRSGAALLAARAALASPPVRHSKPARDRALLQRCSRAAWAGRAVPKGPFGRTPEGGSMGNMRARNTPPDCTPPAAPESCASATWSTSLVVLPAARRRGSKEMADVLEAYSQRQKTRSRKMCAILV